MNLCQTARQWYCTSSEESHSHTSCLHQLIRTASQPFTIPCITLRRRCTKVLTRSINELWNSRGFSFYECFTVLVFNTFQFICIHKITFVILNPKREEKREKWTSFLKITLSSCFIKRILSEINFYQIYRLHCHTPLVSLSDLL